MTQQQLTEDSSISTQAWSRERDDAKPNKVKFAQVNQKTNAAIDVPQKNMHRF